jgi:type IV pilus assembly protein PilB
MTQSANLFRLSCFGFAHQMSKTLIDTLVGRGVIDREQASAIRRDAKNKDITLDDALYQHGILESQVAETRSEITGYPTRFLEGQMVPFDILADVPEESARHYGFVPLGKNDGVLEVGMLRPEDITAQEALKFIASRINTPISVFIITPSDFDEVLKQYKTISGEVSGALGIYQQAEAEQTKTAGGEEEAARQKTTLAEEAPITKIVSVILRHAVEGRASDIHVEPEREMVRVRFRVDGLLHTSLSLPSAVHAALVSRIKVMTNLKIDETRIPQDGRFHADIMDRGIDFRVSTFPTAYGEKVVIRILDPAGGIADLTGLGMEGKNLETLQKALERPYGMILITGPTGSGKSTTLYAILQLLNSENVNIVSLEDPVEYYVPGVNQSQVRPEINYDFATGLRHVVRQDPDIIMVGEIRDKETAALAIHAALTGHLVLSTLHTNNAAGVIPRLIDMGIDPFLISPTLILAIGQRLVRKLCEDSKEAIPLSGKIKETVTQDINAMPKDMGERVLGELPTEIYRARVSATCPKGTRGRTGVFEMLTMTPQLENIILSRPSEQDVAAEAKRQNMIIMRQDGILKVLKGVIGYEELLEVV